VTACDRTDLDGCTMCRLPDWAAEEMADAQWCADWPRYEHAYDLFVDLNERRTA
jgi:hypothetical protein